MLYSKLYKGLGIPKNFSQRKTHINTNKTIIQLKKRK